MLAGVPFAVSPAALCRLVGLGDRPRRRGRGLRVGALGGAWRAAPLVRAAGALLERHAQATDAEGASCWPRPAVTPARRDEARGVGRAFMARVEALLEEHGVLLPIAHAYQQR